MGILAIDQLLDPFEESNEGWVLENAELNISLGDKILDVVNRGNASEKSGQPSGNPIGQRWRRSEDDIFSTDQQRGHKREQIESNVIERARDC